MIVAWLHAVPALAAAAVLIFLPGLPAAWLLRLRGLALAASSIAASFAIIALAAIAAPLVGQRWSPIPVFIVALAVTGAAVVVRLLDRRSVELVPGPARRRRLAWIGAFLLAAALIGILIVLGIGRPEHFSQSYDNVFHLNAVAWILEHGNASPFAMSMTSSDQQAAFYPTLWHACVSLIAELTGASIPLATNALSLAVAAIVWPIAILFFARPFFRESTGGILAAGILAAAFSAFPYRVFVWGILYPNLLSVALLPIALGFLHIALRHHQLERFGRIGAVWIGFVGALGAAALAHPNAVLGLIAIAAPLLVVIARENFRRFGRSPRAWGRLGGIVAVLAAALVLWRGVASADNNRVFGSNPLGAAFGALANAPMTSGSAWFATVLVLAGAALFLFSRRNRWMLASYAVLVVLYAVAGGTHSELLRGLLTVGWYNDVNRIAFLLPIIAVPFAVRAVAELLSIVRVGAAHWPTPAGLRLGETGRRAAGVGIVLLLLLAGTRGPALASSQNEIYGMFRLDKHSELVSKNEWKLIERLPQTVPEDSLIAGNPWNGSALAFALGHRDVLYPHLKNQLSPEAAEFAQDFSDLPPQQACRIANDLGITHMFGSSGPRYMDKGKQYTGLNELRDSDLLTAVDREGEATLYRLTGC